MLITKQTERILSFSFGVLFVTTLIALALFVPNPSPFQYTVFRIILALAAAGVAVTFTGFLEITIPSALKAGGALAVFAVVFFYNPADQVGGRPPSLKKVESPNESSRSEGVGAPAATETLPEIPPDRLLSARPFRIRLADCASSVCDVQLFLRGYDSKGRLRFLAEERVEKWLNGEFIDSVFNTNDRIYFEANETVLFRIACRLGTGPILTGDETEFDWQAWHERGAAGYAKWIGCGDKEFTAEAGIGVGIAKDRFAEGAVKVDPGLEPTK